MGHTSGWFTREAVADGWTLIGEGDPVLPCRSGLVEDDGEALLVDTGLGVADLAGLVEQTVGTRDVPVVLTHSHWDHIGGASAFSDVVIHDRERTADGRVTIDVLSDEFALRPAEFVRNCREQGVAFPSGFDPDQYAIDPVRDVEPVAMGAEISVGDRTLETVPIPGHSPGQLAVVDRTAGLCHAGDIFAPGPTLYAHFEHADLAAYRDSIERLIELRDAGAYDVLTTGHGGPIRGDDLAVLDEVATALDRVRAGDADSTLTETSYGPTRKHTVEGVTVLTAPAGKHEG